MTLRILLLVLLLDICSAPIWAQGGQCSQVVVWGMGGGAGCGSYPDAGFLAQVAGNQAQFGGVGPSCSYTPNPNIPGCWSGQCSSVGWQCQSGQTPPSPRVGGCPAETAEIPYPGLPV